MYSTAPNAETLAGFMGVISDFQRGILERALKPLVATTGQIAIDLLGPIVSSLQDYMGEAYPQAFAPMQAAFSRFKRLERTYPKAFTLALDERKGEIKALEQKLELGFSYETLSGRELHFALFIGIDNKLPWLVHGVILELARRRVALFVALLQMFKKDEHAQKLRSTLERYAQESARAPPRLFTPVLITAQPNAPSAL